MSQWENLTSADFKKELIRSQRVCLLPLGVYEAHGNHMPLCTDMVIGYDIACRAAELERAVVFPQYYFTQILEAKHKPGTIALNPDLLLKLLENVCDEIGRNGFKKIIILNAHGGNSYMIPYFTGSVLLNSKKDYVVYYPEEPWRKWPEMMKNITGKERRVGHGGDLETSAVMAINGGLVKMKELESPGVSLERLAHLPDIKTSVWWYAKFPRHYAGDAKNADAKAGKLVLEESAKYYAKVLRMVKKDKTTPELYREFFSRSNH